MDEGFVEGEVGDDDDGDRCRGLHDTTIPLVF